MNYKNLSQVLRYSANDLASWLKFFKERSVDQHKDLTPQKVFADWLEENSPDSTTPKVLELLRTHTGPVWVGTSPKGKVNAIPILTKEILQQYPNRGAYH